MSRQLLRSADRWLSAPAPAERLAVFRILVGLYGSAYVAIRLPAFLGTADLTVGFEPVGILWFLDQPLPASLIRGLTVASLLLGLLFTAGIRFRLTGPGFAVALLIVATYRSSWGRLLYFDNLLVLHALILSMTRAADAWTLGAIRGRGSSRPGGGSRVAETRPADPIYGWPLRLCALVTVATYVLAGIAKLRIGGAAWIDGTSLRNHVAYSAARFTVLGGQASPIAELLMRQLWLFTPAALATLVLELGAPAALFTRLRTPWVAGLWLMHAAIAASMFVLFPYPLVLVAFAPMYHLELLPDRLRRRRPRTAQRAHESG